MSYYSIEAIRDSCPVIRNGEDAQQLVPVIEEELYNPLLGKTRCKATLQLKIDAGIFDGCRCVTSVSSTGCPLRDGDTITVQI